MTQIRKPGRAGTVDLPQPGEDALRHSRQLEALIQEEINDSGGRISFRRFMERALYTPGLGYYQAGARKFGEAGDFVTAPEISPLFARCLAEQCRQVLSDLDGERVIVEFGAGSGALAVDLLAALECQNALPDRYLILEPSADLQQRQYQRVQETVPHLLERVSWLRDLQGESWCGVVIANEVLDAMPVHRLAFDGKDVQECYVELEEGRFVWRLDQLSCVELQTAVSHIRRYLDDAVMPSPYVTEVNLAGEAWIKTLSQHLQQGVALLIDYGFNASAYYHPQRDQGTLMCHYRHRFHDDPFKLVGLQDITAHVDFTAMAESAYQSGLRVAGYNTQAHFLLATGLTQFLEHTDGDENENTIVLRSKLAQEVKKLTHPEEMGELFKVLAVAKAYDEPLMGFQLQDLRGRL